MLLSQEMALCGMKNCWHRCTKLMEEDEIDSGLEEIPFNDKKEFL